jgi:elongation factor 1 alpha-like protein
MPQIHPFWQVDWSKDRYEYICHQLKTFLVQSGFQMSKTHFVPVGAMSGVNLVHRESQDAVALNSWYSGPTLVELLSLLPPKRYCRPRESLT